MGPKKNSKIILIGIILLVILILVVGIAYACLATDMFKSNKELFFKYVVQMGDNKEGLIETQLKQYFEKQKTTPYTNEGNFALNVASENGNEKQYETINNFNISFEGKTDKTKETTEQDVSINYSNEVTFPINYRKTGNTIGLQTKYVSNKYIALETDKLENTAYEGLDGIEDLQNNTQKLEELTQLPFNEEEGKKIQETIQKILNEQLQDSQFTKVEENKNKGYKLNVEGKQVKNIIIQLLETLKNDQPALEKLNEYVKKQKNSAKITASVIDNYIKEIEENSTIEEENCEISVFQEKGKTTKLEIKLKEVEVEIEKQKMEGSIQYTISIIAEKGSVIFKANYKGLEQLQNVIESYELEMQLEPNQNILINTNEDSNTNNKKTYKYQYNNQINFDNNVSVESFSDDNAMILNNYEEEKVSNFLTQVTDRIKQVNQNQMEELGLEESENPLMQLIEPLFEIAQYTQSINTLKNTKSELQEAEINAFNTRFEAYESTNLKGVTVKGLLTTIGRNNETRKADPDRQIKEIHFDGEEYEVTDQNILLLKSAVETETAYRVEFERDEQTGIIYRAVINKK